MALVDTRIAQPPPLDATEDGTVRLKGTRRMWMPI
jgi:hypothetical protein